MYFLKWVAACCLYILMAACGGEGQPTAKPSGVVSVPGLEGLFKIEKDEYMAPYKRSVEVMLYEELTEEQLMAMAAGIKAVAKVPT